MRWRLGGGVDVFGLGHAAQIVLVAGQAAEEDATANGQNGGTPAKAICPGVAVVALVNEVVVKLDRVDDEGNDLQDNCGSGTERKKWSCLPLDNIIVYQIRFATFLFLLPLLSTNLLSTTFLQGREDQKDLMKSTNPSS